MVEKLSYYDERTINPQLVQIYLDRLGPAERILDLGCGTGGFGREHDGDAVVVGVDVDTHALQTAREFEEVLLVDLKENMLPFANRTFDAVVAKDILEHVPNPRPVVDELYRVLEPGGTVLASVPMAKPEVIWADYTHVRGFTEGAIRTLLKDAGFDIGSASPMGGIPGFGRLGLVSTLPTLLRLPLFRRFAVSHEVLAQKPT